MLREVSYLIFYRQKNSEVKGKNVHNNYIIVLPNNKLITLKMF